MNKEYKPGDVLYLPSAYYISNGSSDMEGGLATISKIETNNGLRFVSFEGFPGQSWNLDYLLEKQEELRKEFGQQEAYPNPDIDTPWIEDGDMVNGQIWDGGDIW